MSHVILPQGYKEKLDLYQTQMAIGRLKLLFQNELAES